MVRRNGHGFAFLLIRDPYENWGLPKGHIEGRESPQDAALREVGEETGLNTLAVMAELPTIDWYYRHQGRLVHKICHFFLVESDGGEPVPQLEEGITACILVHIRECARDRDLRQCARSAARRRGPPAAGTGRPGER